MPKHLFLCRHAHTREAGANQRDFDRELTSAGVSEATETGNFIKSFGLNFQAIICSAARRTQQTAFIIAEAVHFDPEHIKAEKKLYDANAATLLKAITMLKDTDDVVILVGHNPSVSDVAGILNGNQRMHVPTGGCYYFAFDAPNWQSIEWSDKKLYTNF